MTRLKMTWTVMIPLLLFTAAGFAQTDLAGAPPAPPDKGDGVGLRMNGAVGATVLDGETYQYFSFRPEVSVWRLGVGLDLSFYFDSDGNIREQDWDKLDDVLEKIYYIRYNKPGDPLYVRVGSLSPVTMGYGLIMRRYTNAIEWPQVRRIGMEMQVKRGPFGFQAIVNNFQEIEDPGLIAGRLSYRRNIILPVEFGVTVAHDGNQYLGARDNDDDGVPDPFDLFPGKDDYSHIDWLKNTLGNDSLLIDQLIRSGDLPNIYAPPQRINDQKADVTEWGVDVGVPLIDKQKLNLWVYAQMAQIDQYGRGYTVPGVRVQAGPIYGSAEMRFFEKNFMAEFFNLGYELERVVWDADSARYITKSELLEGMSSAEGFYADIGASLFNWVTLFAAYQAMSYDNGVPDKSFYANASLNTSMIPKVSLAEAYYQQSNADKLFTTDGFGTVIGYRIGYDMGQGLSLVFDRRTIYRHGERSQMMTIETKIAF